MTIDSVEIKKDHYIKKRTLLFIIISLAISFAWADLTTISGSLINGRGGIEKCNAVNISLYIDSELQGSTTTDADGNFNLDLSSSDVPDIANDFNLDQNYPNPFNSNTTVSYSLDTDGLVELSVYDIRGRKVSSLIREYQARGYHHAQWDGKNFNNTICPQGIYIYVMKFRGKTEIRKMSLINGVNSGIFAGTPNLMKQSAPSSDILVEIIIEDKDIENKTLSYTYSELPSSLDIGIIPVHVYAFLKESPQKINAMEGAVMQDTLDIYFERPFELTSSDLNISYSFTQDSLCAVEYRNVNKNPSLFRIVELGESKKNYGRAYFEILPRLQAWPRKLRRAYMGKAYSKDIIIENSQGDVKLNLTSDLPSGLSISGRTIEGTPSEKGETMITFNISDESGFTVTDSALLVVCDYNELSFNDYVIDLLEEYHRDGRFPYSWSGGYTGVTKNLYYKGSKVASAKSDSSHVTYCCGVTFEVWLRAMKRLQQDMGLGEDINGMSASNVLDFRSKWFVIQDSYRGPSLALESYRVGEEIHNIKDVQKGDFVQLWRTSGSGHSVIFINWTTNAAGDTTGIRYWSTQTSTNGVNYNTEYFPEGGGNIDKNNTHYSRGFKPEAFE